MTFLFRAHHPSAYFRFALLLTALIAINIFLIVVFYSSLKSLNAFAERSIIFILPWLLLLLLPSVLLGIISYHSFIKSYRFTLNQSSLTVELLNKNESTVRQWQIEWTDLTSARIVDFEDNHYCNLEFTDKKYNLVIHRDSGWFEQFWEELKKFSGNTIESQ